jgi:RNA polymerase sigma-70 factor (ECF subfamily)
LARPALIAAMAVRGERPLPATITPARFDAWYEAYRAPLRAYLRRIVASPAAADDLFQETWVRLLTHPPRTLEHAAVRAYLFTIATHLARDLWRRESWIGRFLRIPRDEILETPASSAPSAAACVEARDDVRRALESLSAKERALLWLAHVEQYDHREIGAIMSLRPESVRVLLHRARKRAQAALGVPGADEGVSR